MTAGYWAFLHKHQEALGKNHRMAKPLGGMRRLSDIDVVVAQEKERTEW
jgi:deoxyribodipyrimidine photolyase-related protein